MVTLIRVYDSKPPYLVPSPLGLASALYLAPVIVMRRFPPAKIPKLSQKSSNFQILEGFNYLLLC